jgi:heterodisulfide reductase subunit B
MGYRSSLEARIAKKTTKAIKDFNLVEDGDRVMVGLSGGKDSWALLQILDELRQRAPIDFSLVAVNVDSGYKDYKHDVIAKTCRERGWEYRIEHTAIGDVMDDLLEAAGAQNVEFALKTACCGGAHTLSDSDTSTRLVLNILRAAELAGADVIATECPTCHSGLEMHQVRAEKVLGEKTTVKVLYFTQLLGIALGLSPRSLGIHENVSDGLAALKAKGLA